MTAAQAVSAFGRWGRERVEGLGRSGRFIGDTLAAGRDVATWWPEATLHARELGVRSLPIALYIAVFTGIVLSLLASYSFTGAVPLYFVGTLVEKTITMELAPVLTGLALAGRVGANIAAELGTMKVTEQVDALETLAYDPHAYLVVPRVLAGTIMFPVVVGLAILGTVALASAAEAREDCFMRIDGVTGESLDARHRGEIEVQSWLLGVVSTNPAGPTGGAGSGRTEFQPLRITQRLERSVPELVQHAATQRHLRSAALTCRRPGRDAADYLKVTLEDVLITSVRMADTAVEVMMAYGRIGIEYRPQMPDGSLGQPVATGWDVRSNQRR